MCVYGLIQLTVACLYLFVASLTDIKTREVPDYLNFSLIGVGFGLAALFSIFSWSLIPFVYSLMGFGLFFGIACLLFYSGQWGGGDAKLLMGLGALFGLPISSNVFNLWVSDVPFLFLFLFFSLVAGGLYGMGWLVYQLVVRRKKLFPLIRKKLDSYKKFRIVLYGILLLFLVLFFYVSNFASKLAFVLLAFLVLILFYLPTVVRVVEEECMVKETSVGKLVEGDWIAKNVVVKGKNICSSKDLGISLAQIKQLKKLKVKNVLVKEGLPFVPPMFVGFLIAVVVQVMF
jgi:prepilin signal peptidase PulO-like enzyme (type II secretory pathway)